jgi:hypothetical protein
VFVTPILPVRQDFAGPETPLPRKKLERLAQRLASGEYSLLQVAELTKCSLSTVKRLNRYAPIHARVAYLREQASREAAAAEPLAQVGQRVAFAGSMARTLREQLDANGYEATIGVTKQGEPIQGFDRGRVAEALKAVSMIHDMTTVKESPIQVTNNVLTTDDLVRRIVALNSRAEGAGTPEGEGSTGGGGG